jgi:hypothetical protein
MFLMTKILYDLSKMTKEYIFTCVIYNQFKKKINLQIPCNVSQYMHVTMRTSNLFALVDLVG